MGGMGILLLLIAAVVIGAAARYRASSLVSWELLLTALTALAGGYVGSEFLGPASAWGPEVDGFFEVPGIIAAGALVAVAVVILDRTVYKERRVHHMGVH